MIKMKKITWLLVLLALLALPACGGGAEASPTADPGAVYTAAVETAYTQLTMTAGAVTDTPAATLTPSITQTPLITNTPLVGLMTNTPFTLATAGPTSAACDNFLFLGDLTIDDGTELAPGEAFNKIWQIQNLGPCTWTTSYSIAFGYGNQMNGPFALNLYSEVLPGETLDVVVPLVAPAESGSYFGAWRMQNDKGYNFGITLTVSIVVP